MDKVVIFIGPDNAGKTTIIKGIQDILDCDVIKYNPAKEEIMRTNLHKAVTEKREKITIWDRFHYPDDIIYDSKSPLIPEELEIRKTFKDALFILVTASEQTLLDRYKILGDPLRSPMKIVLVKQLYDIFYKHNKDNVIVRDTTSTTIEDDVAWCKMMIERYYNENWRTT